MADKTFSPLEYKLYGRQMLLPELGIRGQQKLKNSHLLVVGAGGLGAPALLYLAGAGIGHITVVDDDLVEASNLHRQIIHTYAALGNSKAETAAAAVRSLNPTVIITSVRERLCEDNVDRLFAGVTAVIDGSDNFATRYLVSAACARAGIPHIWGAILGFDAQVSVFWAGRGPVYEDLYPHQPAEGSVPTCATAGVIGAMAGVVGTSMAMEAVKVVAGMGRPLMGELACYSALEGRWEYVPLRAANPVTEPAGSSEPGGDAMESDAPQADFSGGARSRETALPATGAGGDVIECTFADFQRLELGDRALLVDIREPAEFAALAIPGAVNIPLSTLESQKSSDDLKGVIDSISRRNNKTLAIYCSGGPRAARAAQILREIGWGTIYRVTDGISGWLGETLD